MGKGIAEILNSITQDWFLSEPLLFSVFCSHELVENKNIKVPFRSGKMRIEYNPDFLLQMNQHQISEYLKIEAFRILLKHPYQRQPTGAAKPYLSIASDITISANYVTDVKLDGVEQMKELITRYISMQHGMPNHIENAPQNSKANSIVQIPVQALTSYLEKEKAERIKTTADGIECYIDKTKYIFQQNGEFYTKLRWNSLILRYELVQGTGIYEFWRKIDSRMREGKFPKDLCFEEWYTKILSFMELTGEEGSEEFEDGHQIPAKSDQPQKKEKERKLSQLSDLSGLWEQDDQCQEKINSLIEDAEKSEQWGSVGGELKELIQANKKVDMNYAEILRHFSTSLIASKRSLSRMKPNRRFGFDRLGSKYKLTSNLLIAVDISSSITRESLEYVFSVINQFFRYGVEQIDVIQFDVQIQGEPMEMKRAVEYIQLNGRGGTEFQPAADFYCNHKAYDGMIYFTDGFGPHPEFTGRQTPNVLWIFTTKAFYEKGKKWADKIPGNSSTYIPLP